ncbi:MAG: hypothetical protein K2N28_01370 [Muribaculaceae bacterium]|nr:hypothetical protein [Muribaculaceae bacterium]
MKLTLSNKFFTNLLQLDPKDQSEVLSTCKRLTESTDEDIEQLELPADTQQIIIEVVNNLKKRIRTARRRRLSRAAKAKKSSIKPDNVQQTKSPANNQKISPDKIIEMYELAVEVVIAAGNTLNNASRSRIRQLAKTLMKRMDSLAVIAAASRAPRRFALLKS